MSQNVDGAYLRKVLLEKVKATQDETRGEVLQDTVLLKVKHELGDYVASQEGQEEVLNAWYDLFRLGYLSWGKDLGHPDPPWCHTTSQGRTALRNLSRDPINSSGYLQSLQEMVPLNDRQHSYIYEALTAYNSNCHRSAAVMVGIATEYIILEILDFLKDQGYTNKNLKDWKMKRILLGIRTELDKLKSDMDNDLQESYESLWPAFTYLIRTARNEAGHPTLEPVTHDQVHCSFLLFPELAKLAYQIQTWLKER